MSDIHLVPDEIPGAELISNVTGFVSLFEDINIPEIEINFTGNNYSGKTKIACKIAEFLLAEFGLPIKVISGDGDFLKAFERIHGIAPNTEPAISRKPRDLSLKPVKITLVDTNNPFVKTEAKAPFHQYTLW